MTVKLSQEIRKSNPSAYIELYTVDTTTIGGSLVFYFTPMTNGSNSSIVWQGNTYTPFPIQATGFTSTSDGTAPARPTLALSNATKYLMTQVIALGDLVGAKVIRMRTFARFLDGQPDADPTSMLPVQTYFIGQKSKHTKTEMQFVLVSQIDSQVQQLPGRQILKDLGFPGVSYNIQ